MFKLDCMNWGKGSCNSKEAVCDDCPCYVSCEHVEDYSEQDSNNDYCDRETEAIMREHAEEAERMEEEHHSRIINSPAYCQLWKDEGLIDGHIKPLIKGYIGRRMNEIIDAHQNKKGDSDELGELACFSLFLDFDNGTNSFRRYLEKRTSRKVFIAVTGEFLNVGVYAS